MINQENNTFPKFEKPLNEDITFGVLTKVYPTEGNMAWEYNPFRNYRLDAPKYYFRGKYFTQDKLIEELGGIPKDDLKDKDGKDITVDEFLKDQENWTYFNYSNTRTSGIKDNEQNPELYDKNQLVDFETTELGFDLSHPVNILPQYSYDGSVNLIINDGKNHPRLINSRFSPLGRNKYQIVDRKGNNDTNIYDQGKQFDIDTSLYKTYTTIPKLDFIGVFSGGNLSIGNYHFYFRYADADGNETDFVAESGLVSIFKGNSLTTINSGFRNENSHKCVRFILENIDPAYSYVNVYYTKSTADIYQNPTIQSYKIDQKFLVNNSSICNIFITGAEPKTEITVEEINPFYQIAENVQTQAQCQNMLFLGNIQNQNIKYSELSNLSLHFCPEVNTISYDPVDHTYNHRVEGTYSDPNFIYNYTGYQNGEIYRFGIVYILNNGSLSPVFNIRGRYLTKNDEGYTKFSLGDTISYNETSGRIYNSTEISDTNKSYTNINNENAFGVLRIYSSESELQGIRGIKITLKLDTEEVKGFQEKLEECNVKGFFFVRQKRMPLRLCQGYTIGIDSESHTPLLYTKKIESAESENEIKSDLEYITERFFNKDKELNHNIDEHLYAVPKSDVNKYGAICPEYDINSPYLNTLFCGDQYIVQQASAEAKLTQDPIETRHFYATFEDKDIYEGITYETRVLGVEDNVKLVAIGNKMFSARAGEAEEAHRFEFITRQNKTSKAVNIIRGSFGPYLALDGYNLPGTLINIYVKDWMSMSIEDQFKLRYTDKSPFYAISDRYTLEEGLYNIEEGLVLYRGDSYICTFTHRVNRNFQDPSAPINHQIVDYECWKNNFSYKDPVTEDESGILNMEEFAKINLGDVNAVKLGMWVTFSVVSSINLNIRALDDSIPDEMSLVGHPRGFYPYSGMSADGPFKTPEALCYNKGFEKSLSERWNYEVPDVPAIKNDFTNRIAYSDIAVNDAFKNGFRVFQGTHYRDYPKTYGQITKLIELNDQILCVFEHGVSLIPVNERALAGEGSGGNIYINTSNVLPERMKVISDTFGSQWRESVIKTPKGVYGVDTVAKKIWRCNGSELQVISDFHVQEFLNNNISLTEREIDPIIGIRNVKTHYNKFKQDVMFTFYDNLYGFEEKVWNLCWSELLNKWITFYSWVPSYSENIYNQYFSFDRNTSKWIAKLGISKHNGSFSDGVTLENNIIPNEGEFKQKLYLDNRTLPKGENVESYIEFELVRDPLKNYEHFEIVTEITDNSDKIVEFTDDKGNIIKIKTLEEFLNLKRPDLNFKQYLVLKGKDENNIEHRNYLFSEFYSREGVWTDKLYSNLKTELKKDPTQKEILNSEYGINWINSILNNSSSISKDENGRRIWLSHDAQINNTSPITLLNIQAHIQVRNSEYTPELVESFNNSTLVDAGYYQSTVAVCPQYNMQFLTTDFWKHGQSGIIDIADDILPTHWYGKQHPFEFEFVVAGDPRTHKIFDSLQIISNKAEPESFHYEVIGECYDFAYDKKNMYIRQEATKELYQYNGSNILFDSSYSKLNEEHFKIPNSDHYRKSTLFPLYYARQKGYNEVEDYYHLKDGTEQSKDFSNLTGSEIVRYKNLDEYRIWTHAKAVDVKKHGLLRGNMQYKEDKWYVQLNPINLVQKNEGEWESNKIPVELEQNPLPNDIELIYNNELHIPESFESRGFTFWDMYKIKRHEIKPKDKYIKIRVRYSGKDLALIAALNTLYSISIS